MIGQLKRIEKLKASLSGMPTQSNSKKNIIAFTSGKGGTGKTVIAVNTAHALSKAGYKILLVDADFYFGNVNILLNDVTKCTIEDYLSCKRTFKDIIHNHSENLDCIYAASGSDLLFDIEKADIRRLMGELKAFSDVYDAIIIDSSSGGSQLQLEIISKTNINVLVLLPEPTSIMDSYVIMKLLKKHRFEGFCYAIINKVKEAEDNSAFENLRSAARHFLGAEVELLGIINFSYRVTESIINQSPFIITEKQSDLSEMLNEISQRLSDIIQVANNKQPHPEPASFF